MATLVLSAAGAALGGSLGGSILGLTTMALGRAAGGIIGSMIDGRLLGAGAQPVETGRVDRLRVMGSSEGSAIPRVFGRMRLPGQLIWSSRFVESVSEQRVGGGKATSPPRQTVREYSYSVSLALALCEGEVMRVGRIWADGQPLPQRRLVWRLHRGTETQLPDPLIAAIEGAGNAPAYRGTAYVVIEDLDLGPYGNRIPQLNFEVFRRARAGHGGPRPAALDVRGVALVPGTGEYSLATRRVRMERGRGSSSIVNVNNDRGVPDLVASLDQLSAELPSCKAVSLVVSWFSDDLRIDRARLYPAVEQRSADGAEMPWRVCGVKRADARVVSRIDGRPLFGGTPADAAVVQAIQRLRASGQKVMFYPFILLDIVAGNGRPDPWAPGAEQPPVPWRGRMTLSRAPGTADSPDQTPDAAAEVAAFFGAAQRSHFGSSGGQVVYSGPAEWSYRRFVLHYARLCTIAGGVDAFCVGSEMRSLTQIRDGRTSYPAVRELCRLAEDVRAILGTETKISYAADWSEYFGHQPGDGSGDAVFHLDPFWSHPAVDFVGIDNYMPLSDWRDTPDHADAAAGSIYDLDYLTGNVAGGEGFDWYYPDQAARERQERAAIEDGAYGQPWIYRYKDIRGWWGNPHIDRVGGVRVADPTPWVPRSKPIWFTELGCPAVDKGTNQPNVFFDPKSSESFLPYFSTGATDDFIQQRYLQATFRHWSEAANNPVSAIYGGRMVDLDRAFVWAWDARPWPDFPNRLRTWIDGTNHARGHWLNGRIAKPALAEVVHEICVRSNIDAVDVTSVWGVVTGYLVNSVETARQSLQPLMLAFGVDAHPAAERIRFRVREGGTAVALDLERLAVLEGQPRLQRTRSSRIDLPERAAVSFVRADQDYLVGAVEATAPEAQEPSTEEIAVPLVMTTAEAQAVAERWLAEARVAAEALEFSLPPSALSLSVGDVVEVRHEGHRELFRIDRIDERGLREAKAVKVDEAVFEPHRSAPTPLGMREIEAPTPAHAEFLDLPLLRGDEIPHAVHVAVVKSPWTGPVAVYASAEENDFRLSALVERPATMGALLDPLPAGLPGLWMRRSFRVQLDRGVLTSREKADVLNGANVAVLKGAGRIEVLQFTNAELIGPLTYRLDGLLRGQAGTDADMPSVWPEGTDFVLIDSALKQLDLPASTIGLERRIRYGPEDVAYSDEAYRETVIVPGGLGLRPLRPVHLRWRALVGGGIGLSWIRRTRSGGDGWLAEVPVGEETLAFALRLSSSGRLLRNVVVGTTEYTYDAAAMAADAATLPLVAEVAQISAVLGAGPYQRITIDG